MSSELAEMVGSAGSVLGIDASFEQIQIAQAHAQKKGLKNVSFEELSVHKLSQLSPGFDAIYARFILCHITAVEQVLIDAHALLKSGGLIFCEDLCGLDALFCYPPHPGYMAHRKVIKAQFDVQKTDSEIGVKLPYMLSQAGFKRLFGQIQQPILSDANQKKVFRLGVKEVASTVVSAGRLSEKELEDAQVLLETFENDDSTFAAFFRYAQIAYQK
jgi:ubiquinone/menaquinone biosynthesis C-methylase UbiE